MEKASSAKGGRRGRAGTRGRVDVTAADQAGTGGEGEALPQRLLRNYGPVLASVVGVVAQLVKVKKVSGQDRDVAHVFFAYDCYSKIFA